MGLEVVDNVLDLIGNTPMLSLDRIRIHYGMRAQLFAKLEFMNPGGSVKDRTALKMILEAENQGEIKPGDRIIELTSGNLGIGLALVSALRGYSFTAVMSEGNSAERRKILRALGAKVVLVPQEKGGEIGQVTKQDLEKVEEKTQRLVAKYGAFRPDQFRNPANPLAHEEGTGIEIWKQLGGRIDYFVAIVGTGGTFLGISRALKKRDPRVRCIAVEPAAAPVLAGKRIKSTKHKIQGTGYATIPPQWDSKLCDGYLEVTDSEAITASRLLATKEGLIVGFSGGANVAAALKLGRTLATSKKIVTIMPDTGLKYLTTDLFG